MAGPPASAVASENKKGNFELPNNKVCNFVLERYGFV